VTQSPDTAQSLVDDPAWMPFAYDPAANTFVFAHAPRELQRKLVFLDRRFLADAPKSAPISAHDLARPAQHAAKPVHFIFHTAFCCSTLLSRALDAPGVSMGVKEPAILVPLSHPPLMQPRSDGVDPLAIALDLLSRPLTSGETQIVKPSNAANALAAAILDRRPTSKALVLYSSLDAYLRSSGRMGMTGRQFNRQMFAQLAQSIPLLQPYKVQELMLQTDLQIAAQVWLMQAKLLDAIAKQVGAARVRTLNSATLLADKLGTLQRLGAFFDLSAGDGRWAEIASGPEFDREAKSLDETPFDPAAKQAADRAHAPEIAAVMPWAQSLAAQAGVPLTLGDTLHA
jgi:hypothetical protein